jgi:hypothetical protein
MIRRLMHNWEQKLATRTNNRVVRPFEWGAEFLSLGPFTVANSRGERDIIFDFNEQAVAASDIFFGLNSSPRFSFDGYWLTFKSLVETPYEANNTVYGRFFPVPASKGEPKGSREEEILRAKGRAVIVLPQWNGDSESHIGLCRALNRFGMAALRLSLPYHDRRMLPGFERADYMVSANIGRTLQAIRQAVIDTRAAIDWLMLQGYDRIGITGTSLGSCVSFLAFIHDERLRAGAFNMVSSYFGDVVWDGMATAHVRQSLETAISREEARRLWLAISPNAYVHRLADNPRPGLLVSARYDLTFTPELSELLFDECRRHNTGFRIRKVPWGHYTMGEAPFKYYDGYLLINHLRKNL